MLYHFSFLTYSPFSTLLLLVSFSVTFAQAQNDKKSKQVEYYKGLFNLQCAEDKATNNQGDGNSILYGTRNFRTILHGIAYRGGGNNYYHKSNKRNNKNPLPNDGLQNLADLNFDSAVYLYETNFETAPSIVKGSNGNKLDYFQIGGNTQNEMRSILEMTYSSITQPEKGPVYLHCWNGWHQSGFVSAVILRQFCDLSEEEAVHYWKNNTDTWNNGYERIKTAIREFKPYEDLKIDESMKKLICPCMEKAPISLSLDEEKQMRLKNTISVVVPFENNSADITPGALTAIDEYIVLLRDNPFFEVEIGGHSSSPGSEVTNQILSERRAKLVYDYLISEGIDAERLAYKGYGEKELIALGSDENAHAINRRIEFKVVGLNLEIQFLKNQYEIPQEFHSELLFVRELLNANQDFKIIINGHTDISGDPIFNKNLSQLRAKSVFQFLLKYGISSDRMKYEGFGSSKPRYSNDNELGRSKNRRIEVLLNKID